MPCHMVALCHGLHDPAPMTHHLGLHPEIMERVYQQADKSGFLDQVIR
jgi:hypothetical protein